MVTTKENAANKDIFKDLISKLNVLSDKAEEAENVLTEYCKDTKLPKSAVVLTDKLPVGAEKTTLTEHVGKHQDTREILGRFNALFEDNIKPVLLEDTATTEFDLAVKTIATSTGVKIGLWEIKKLT